MMVVSDFPSTEFNRKGKAAMDSNNLVVVRGVVSSEPNIRELPAGGIVTQLDVVTRTDGRAAAVPVAVYDRTVDAAAGDEVVVTGHVRRRFFRAAGVTQSRTEVVAAGIARASRRRTIEKMLTTVVSALLEADSTPDVV